MAFPHQRLGMISFGAMLPAVAKATSQALHEERQRLEGLRDLLRDPHVEALFNDPDDWTKFIRTAEWDVGIDLLTAKERKPLARARHAAAVRVAKDIIARRPS